MESNATLSFCHNVTAVTTEDNNQFKACMGVCVCVLVHSMYVGHGNGSDVLYPREHSAVSTYII